MERDRSHHAGSPVGNDFTISASVANINYKRNYGRLANVDPAETSSVSDMETDQLRLADGRRSVRRTSGFDGMDLDKFRCGC